MKSVQLICLNVLQLVNVYIFCRYVTSDISHFYHYRAESKIIQLLIFGNIFLDPA